MRQTFPTRKEGRSTPLPWPGLDQSIAAFGRPGGRGWVHGGYYTVGWRSHPLSNAEDRVAVHRAVSWEAAGLPAPAEPTTPCSLCHFRLPWRIGARPRANRYVVNVGFLNADRDDLRPENLAAFCYWCNANRGWLSSCRPGSWAGYLGSCKHIAPWQRPSLLAAFHLAAASEGAPLIPSSAYATMRLCDARGGPRAPRTYRPSSSPPATVGPTPVAANAGASPSSAWASPLSTPCAPR